MSSRASSGKVALALAGSKVMLSLFTLLRTKATLAAFKQGGL